MSRKWEEDPAGLVSAVQSAPTLWHRDSALKYITLRIDTRDGHFLLLDRRNKPITRERVMRAVREAP
jgi:hypothetical protein